MSTSLPAHQIAQMAPFKASRFQHIGAHPCPGETFKAADKIAQRQIAFAYVRRNH